MEENWQTGLREAFRDPAALAAHLGIPLDALPPLSSGRRFPLLVPRHFADLMRPGDPSDPLLRQVWPDAAEDRASAGEALDPVGDAEATLGPGLLRKYHGRALVVATGSCAVHCRYCFRRHFPYSSSPPSAWREQIGILAAAPSVRECVLSGGDPLMLPDSVIESRLRDLEAIPHISFLRIHTRLPVVLPSRAAPELARILGASRLRTTVVLHANHPAEISPELVRGAGILRGAGVHLLNQSVLLAGVNDSVAALEELSLRLWEAGILPYYLHALDPVEGSSRFAVPDAEGVALVRRLRGRLPGYLVPRLARETAGEDSKTILAG